MTSRINTWDQLNFGGHAIRFHSETLWRGTTNQTTTQWECEDPSECVHCHTYNQGYNNKEN
jgi:hypothetical protein